MLHLVRVTVVQDYGTATFWYRTKACIHIFCAMRGVRHLFFNQGWLIQVGCPRFIPSHKTERVSADMELRIEMFSVHTIPLTPSF